MLFYRTQEFYIIFCKDLIYIFQSYVQGTRMGGRTWRYILDGSKHNSSKAQMVKDNPRAITIGRRVSCMQMHRTCPANANHPQVQCTEQRPFLDTGKKKQHEEKHSEAPCMLRTYTNLNETHDAFRSSTIGEKHNQQGEGNMP